MVQNVENKVQEENTEDVLISSVIGFEDKDLNTIESQKDIKELEYGYEAQLKEDSTGYLISVVNMPYKIGRPTITSGRSIQSKDEIVLDEELKENFKIGDVLNFRKESGLLDTIDDNDDLNNYSYKVVGFANSLNYISNRSRGQSLQGLGEIKGFAYISPEQFNKDISFAKIIYKNTNGIETSSKKYKEALKPYLNSLDVDFNRRPEERYSGLKDDLTEEILRGEVDIDDAKKQLEEGKDKLDEAKDKLQDGKDQLKDGEKELQTKSKDGKDKLNTAKEKLDSSKKEIEDNKKKLQDGDKDLKEAEKKLKDSETQLSDGKKKIIDAKSQIDTGEKEYNDGEKKYERGVGELTASRTSLDQADTQLKEGRKKLDEGFLKIEESKQKLADGMQKYNDGLKQYQDGEQQYQDGLSKIANGLGTEANLDAVDKKLTENESYMKIVDKAVEEYNKLNAQIDSLKQSVELKEAELKEIDQEIANLNSEKNSIDPSNPKYAELEQQIAIKTAQRDSLSEEAKTLRQNYEAIVQAKTQAESEISNISQKYGGVDIINEYPAIKAKLLEARQGVNKLKSSRQELDKAQIQLETSKKQLEDGQKQLQEGIETAEAGEKEYQENLSKFKDGQAKYEQGKKELTEARQKLDDAKTELENGKQKLKDAENEYDEGLKKYSDGKVEYEKGKSEYNSGKERLKDGEKIYEDGLKQYEDSEKTYNEQISEAQEKLNKASRELYKGEKDLKEGQKEYQDKKEEAEGKITDGEKKLDDAKKVLKILKIPRYSITPRYSNSSLDGYLGDAHRVDMLATVFPGFFFLIAMLVIFTTMTRMVEEDRTTIGTYKALGFTPKEISKKYFIYGGSAAVIGGILGAILGSTILTRIIGNAYSTTTIFEDKLIYYQYPVKIIASIFAGFLFSVVSALISIKATLSEKAANLLRQKAPSSGNRILLERIPLVWNHLSFLFKVTARNLFRYKKRMIMTIIGIMGCTALLILGFGLDGSVQGIVAKQFDEILNYNVSVTYDRDIDEESYEEYKQFRENNNFDTGKFNLQQFEFEYKDVTENLTMVSFDSNSNAENFIKVRDRKTKNKIDIPESGVVLSEKTAKILNLKVGDTLKISNQEGIEYNVEVSGIMEMYMGHYAIMNSQYYERVFKENYEPNTDFYKIKDVKMLKDKLAQYKSVVSVMDMSSIKEVMNQYMYSINKVQVIITVASALLAMIVLYNLTNINIEERKRELSTIKVLGFYPKETTTYVYRETWTLTIIGIFIGLFMGKLLHHTVLQIVVPYEAMLDPALTIDSYARAIMITLAVNLIIMIIFHNKLKKIDMVESLKSNE